MSRRITTLIVLVVLVLGYPAAAWLIGIIVESQTKANEQKALAEVPYVVLVKRDYHRGIYTSTEEATYQLSLPIAQAASGKSSLDAWRVTVRHLIHHGPLPRMRTFALATADTEVDFPAASQQLRSLLGGKAPVELHTRMEWLGGSTTSFASPAFTLKLNDGTIVNWRGISGTAAAKGGLTQWSGSLTAPGLAIDHTSGRVELQTLTLSADMRRAYDTFDIGKASVKSASIAVRSADAGFEGALNGVAVNLLSSQNGDYVDSAFELSVDSLTSSKFSATRIGYAVSFNHVHGPSYAAFAKDLRIWQREALLDDKDTRQSKLGAAFQAHGIDVLLHDPVLAIPRVGFVTPEGEMRLSAKLRAPGLKREDLQGPLLAAAILQHLEAEADLRVDATLIPKLMSAKQNPEALQQQISMMERQGYLKHDGGQYTVHVTFDHGKTTVNGRPFPAAGTP